MANSQKSSTRELVLKAAGDLIIASHNLDEITIRRLAALTGISIGLINYHFGSRDQLLRLAVRQALNQHVIAGFGSLTQAGSVHEQLVALIRGPLDFLADHPRLAAVSILFDLEIPAEHDAADFSLHELEFACRRIIPAESLPPDLKLRLWSVVANLHEALLRRERFLAHTGLDLGRDEGRQALAEFLAHSILAATS